MVVCCSHGFEEPLTYCVACLRNEAAQLKNFEDMRIRDMRSILKVFMSIEGDPGFVDEALKRAGISWDRLEALVGNK